MNKQLSRSIQAKIRALNNAKTVLPKEVGDEMVSFFKSSWKKGGFENTGVQIWKPKKKPNGKPTLYGDGDLVNSVMLESANWITVRVKSDLPYSAIHNYGLQGKAFGKHPFTMPKRQFMGSSVKMNRLLTLKFERKLNWVFKQK
jgi:phage gpG-like protein